MDFRYFYCGDESYMNVNKKKIYVNGYRAVVNLDYSVYLAENFKFKKLNHITMKKTLTCILFALFSTTFVLAQETVTYQPAQYSDGPKGLVRRISENVNPDSRLLSQMDKEGIREVSATIGLIINTKGKLVAIDLLQTSHPKFNEKYFERLVKVLGKDEFIPGKINGEPAVTSIVLKGIKLGITSTVNYTKRKEGRGTFKMIR